MERAEPRSDRLFTLLAGHAGPWIVEHQRTVVGQPLAAATRLTVVAGAVSQLPVGASWLLRGIRSNERYVEGTEQKELVQKQEGLGRLASTHAALLPIKKTAAWWALPQDERRRIFETRSQHIGIGLRYLPGIARRLLHCRDLGPDEPFDFLTWFEFAPADAPAFDELLRVLRATPEWEHVEREIDIRLVRDDSGRS